MRHFSGSLGAAECQPSFARSRSSRSDDSGGAAGAAQQVVERPCDRPHSKDTGSAVDAVHHGGSRPCDHAVCDILVIVQQQGLEVPLCSLSRRLTSSDSAETGFSVLGQTTLEVPQIEFCMVVERPCELA